MTGIMRRPTVKKDYWSVESRKEKDVIRRYAFDCETAYAIDVNMLP